MATEGSLGTLSVDIRANMDSLNNSLNTVNTRMQSIGESMTSIGKRMSLAITAPLGVLAGVSIKTASQVESSIQQIDAILGDSSSAFQSWATNTSTSFNMSESSAYRYGAVFGNLIKSISDDSEYITQNTVRLLEASAVTASATGRTMEDVMERIRSGMLGNTEAIILSVA